MVDNFLILAPQPSESHLPVGARQHTLRDIQRRYRAKLRAVQYVSNIVRGNGVCYMKSDVIRFAVCNYAIREIYR